MLPRWMSFKSVLIILMAFALLVGGAHREVARAVVPDAAVEAYLAAGGALDQLCLTGDRDGSSDPAGRIVCPDCTLCAATALPQAAPPLAVPQDAKLIVYAETVDGIAAIAAAQWPQARGPPQFLD
jgi:hypothetical protein